MMGNYEIYVSFPGGTIGLFADMASLSLDRNTDRCISISSLNRPFMEFENDFEKKKRKKSLRKV